MPATRHNNTLVLIQQSSNTEGQYNDTLTWTKFKEEWVSITPQRGREVFKSQEKEAVVTHKIRGDFLSLEGIDETMRIVVADNMDYGTGGGVGAADTTPADARVFNILAVMPDDDGHDDIMISCVKDTRPYGKQG